jgi:competence protein ComEA
MNPFLESTVAAPLGNERLQYPRRKQIKRARRHWSLPFAHQASESLALRASMAVMLAGVGVGLSAQALELNTASAEQLKDLRGVGPRTAQIIVQERDRAGPFESLEDLSDRVRGIGRKRLQFLQAAGLRVSESVDRLSSSSSKAHSPADKRSRSRIGSSAQDIATPTIQSLPPGVD